MPAKKEPFFVFAHIVAPHPPFIFNKDGSFQSALANEDFSIGDGSEFTKSNPEKIGSYRTRYIEQLVFINQKILQTVDGILKQSIRPTVIILQGDHGPGSELDWKDAQKSNFKERLSILNAYYFSDQKYDQLYQSISPVNSFKVVFNKYFQSDYKLDPDKSYFSLWDKPYKFIDATDRLK